MNMTVKTALTRLGRYNGQSGTCWDDPSNLARLNEARRLIYERGDFSGTTDWAVIDASDGTFALPFHLDEARAVYKCRKPVEINSQGWAILDCECNPSEYCAPCPGVKLTRIESLRPYACKPPSPLFSLAVSSSAAADAGIEVTLELESRAGVRSAVSAEIPLEDRGDVDGLWADVIAISKPATVGTVTVWAKTADSECLLLSQLPPGAESADVRRYKAEGICPSEIVVFGKKRFFDLTSPQQELDIISITALIHAYRALNALEADDDTGYINRIQLMENSLHAADHNRKEAEPSAGLTVAHEFTVVA